MTVVQRVKLRPYLDPNKESSFDPNNNSYFLVHNLQKLG